MDIVIYEWSDPDTVAGRRHRATPACWRVSGFYERSESTKPPLSNKGGHKKQETIDTTKRKTLYLQGKTAFDRVLTERHSFNT